MASSLSGYDIAVIGLAGRFPGARNVQEFWRNLRAGVESVRFFTDDELRAAGETPENLSDPAYVRARPVLQDHDRFDAKFFGISPQDAAVMDPQHRVFLEVGHEALEDAGHDAEAFAGNIAVFATCGMNTYMMYNLIANRRIMENVGEWLVRHTGNDMNFLATRLSYELNLKGPSMNVQTACSSALVAVHLACLSLLSGECDMALAGGCTIALPQDRGYLYKPNEILSPDGHCRPFDAKARGTLFGSGAGVVVLRRLADALADRDRILAVVRGSAINNDGSGKVGYLAPSVEGQARAVAEAMAVSGVGPEEISYVEAHGTGTIVGDPIEVTALTQAYRQSTTKQGFCAIGSVKSNIGHLGEAAGAAAFIKTVLALSHRELPPTLHYESPNPQIDFGASPFYVNARLAPWNAPHGPRRAGITSLGAGGTNCHVIVEQAPTPAPSSAGRPCQLLLLSAATPSALDAATANLGVYLHEHPEVNLADVAFTLHAGRRALPHRRAIVCRDHATAITACVSGQGVITSANKATDRTVAFLFPGQGAQCLNMGRGLYHTEPAFRAEVDQCAAILLRDRGLDLRKLLFVTEETETARHALNQTSVAQPALFVIEYALARLWQSWGLEPAAMLGHSIGEYVGACIAGVFSLTDALGLVADRGRLMQQAPPGAMLAVALPVSEVEPLLARGGLSLAVVNSPQQSVVAGAEGPLTALAADLAQRGVTCHRLKTSHAFHSVLMDPILPAFAQCVRRLQLYPPTSPYLSNVTGTWARPDEVTNADYWVAHLRNTVRYADCFATLMERADQVLVEVGPGRTLSDLARQQPTQPHGLVTSLTHSDHAARDQEHLLRAFGSLWTFGCPLDAARLYAGQQRLRVSLPTYPFEHQRYWIEADKPQQHQATSLPPPCAGTLAKRSDIADWFLLPTWRHTLLTERASRPHRDDGAEAWLVFVDESALACDLIDHMREQQGSAAPEFYCVRPARTYRRTSKYEFTVNPGHAPDYIALLAALENEPTEIARIAHFWNVTADSSGKGSVANSLDCSFFSVTWLIQALLRRRWTHGIDLAIISTEMQQVAGENRVQPLKATLLGPCRVTPREHPSVNTQSIDLPLIAVKGWQRQRAIRWLHAELNSPSSERVVAYRNSGRWVQRYEPAPLGATDRGVALRQGGVYLITGGLGGLGLEFAEYLCRTVAAKVVLVGRSVLPDRDEWDLWINNPEAHDPISAKIRRLRRCEAAGGNVLVLSADVTNARRMRAVVAETRKRFGPIHGVIHAAGTFEAGLIQLKTRAAAWKVLAPKVQGALVLDEVLRGVPLDFFVLFSSVSSALGPFGHVDYAAANAFVDAFAASRTASGGGHTVAINWGIWQDIGMATQDILVNRGGRASATHATSGSLPEATKAEAMAFHHNAIRQGMAPHEGVEAFARIVAHSVAPQVIVSPVSFEHWMQQTDGFAEAKPEHCRRTERASQRQRAGVAVLEDRVEQQLAELFSQLLGVDEVGRHADFFELGGHSLLAVRLLTRIEKVFNRAISLAELFQGPTIEHLGRSLRGASDKPDRLKVIVPFNEQGNGPAFYCVHSLGGEVISFRHLARLLGPEHRFYGIQVPPDSQNADFACSVEAMADHYVKALLAFQPDGPYLLGGWSAGSVIALEMAQRLKATGRDVQLLVCLDGAPNRPETQTRLWNPMYYWKLVRNVPHWVADDLLKNFDVLDLTRRVRSKLIAMSRAAVAVLRRAEEPAVDVSSFVDMSHYSPGQAGLMNAMHRALCTYVTQPYDGRVLLFKARTQPLYHLLEVERAWQRTASEVEIVIVPGTHISIVREPYVRPIAEHLRRRLAELRAEDACRAGASKSVMARAANRPPHSGASLLPFRRAHK